MKTYRLQTVAQHEVGDILHVMRYLPLVKAAAPAVQQCKTLQDLPLSKFRHLAQALSHLISWVQGKRRGRARVHPHYPTKYTGKADSEGSIEQYTPGDKKNETGHKSSRRSFKSFSGDVHGEHKSTTPEVTFAGLPAPEPFVDVSRQVIPSRRAELLENVPVIKRRQVCDLRMWISPFF